MQVGGRVLGKGAYGCTLEPAPYCKGGPVFKDAVVKMPMVGKVVSEDRADVLHEVAIGKRIMSLGALASNYFAVPTEECEPKISLGDKDARECSIIEKELKRSKEKGLPAKLSMMLMPMAGETFSKWASSDIDRLNTHYEKMFIHLLEGMVMYQRAGYIHNDIHAANILVDSKNVPRYIDFGRAFNVRDSLTLASVYLGKSFAPSYMLYSPELHLIEILLGGKKSLENGLDELVDAQYKYYNVLAHHFLRPDIQNMKSWVSILAMFEGMDEKGVLEFVRKYAKQFDSWRIGIIMWLAWSDLMSHGKKVKPVFRVVLDGLTKFDVRERWTAEKALQILSPKNVLYHKV
jgi:serine/threonine protein kinase